VVRFDSTLYEYYQKVIGIRKSTEALRRGSFKTVLTDNSKNVFAFERESAGNDVLVVLNNDDKSETVTLPLNIKATYADVLNDGRQYETNDGTLMISLDPKSGCVLVRQ
jgi:cyclomaltodextrinase